MMDRSGAQRYAGNAILSKTMTGGFGDTKTITEEHLDKIFTDHQNNMDDKSSIYTTKSKTARRPIKSLANMRGKIGN